jgi:hypothetical protein
VRVSGATNEGTLEVANGGSIQLTGTLTNQGEVRLLGAGNTTTLALDGGDVTLSGGGRVVLQSQNDHINSGNVNNGSDRLVNVDNTIVGQGEVGVGGRPGLGRRKRRLRVHVDAAEKGAGSHDNLIAPVHYDADPAAVDGYAVKGLLEA